MNVREQLQAARDLIETHGWTHTYFARNAAGDSADCFSSTAVCFCILGALRRVRSPTNGSVYTAGILDALEKAAETSDLVGWNDRAGRTKEEVLAVFTRALELVP